MLNTNLVRIPDIQNGELGPTPRDKINESFNRLSNVETSVIAIEAVTQNLGAINDIVTNGGLPAYATQEQALDGTSNNTIMTPLSASQRQSLLSGRIVFISGESTQTTYNRFLSLTGSAVYTTTLASPIEKDFDNCPSYIIWNNSATDKIINSEAAYFIGPAGSGKTSLTISAWEMREFVFNTTNWVVSGNDGGLNKAIVLSQASTITNYNKFFTILGTSGYTTTLGTPPESHAGIFATFFNNTEFNQTIATTDLGRFINGSSWSTLFVIKPRATVSVAWDGVNWALTRSLNDEDDTRISSLEAAYIEARPAGRYNERSNYDYGGRFVTIAPGARQFLAQHDGGPGYISSMYLVLNNRDDFSELVINTDGREVYRGPVGLFFAATYAATQSSFHSKYFSASNGCNQGGGPNTWGGMKSNNVSFYSELAIPFDWWFEITLTNQCGIAHSVPWTIAYQTGVKMPGRSRKLYAPCVLNNNVGPYAWTDICNLSGMSRGFLFGSYIMIDAVPGGMVPIDAYKEGGLELYLDSETNYRMKTQGLEDSYWFAQNYFEGYQLTASLTQPNTNPFISDYHGLTINQLGTTAAYRIYRAGQIQFDSAVRLSHQMGQLNGPGDGREITAGTAKLNAIAWIYTE